MTQTQSNLQNILLNKMKYDLCKTGFNTFILLHVLLDLQLYFSVIGAPKNHRT